MTSLDLSGNLIGYTDFTGMVAIGEGLKSLSHLTYLDLSANFIGSWGSTGTVALGDGLKSLSSLTRLDLSDNVMGYIDFTGTVAIGEGLKYLPSLTHLDLSTNGIGYKDSTGTVALGDGLKSLSSLIFLDLSTNYIGYIDFTGTVAIGAGLQNNKALKTLNLGSNELGQHGSEGLEALLSSVLKPGLSLNLGGAVNIPWTIGANALYTLNADPIKTACRQQRCFGGSLPQNTTAPQSMGSRKLFSLKEYNKYQETFSSDSLWDALSPGQRRTLSAAFGDDDREEIYKGLALEIGEEEDVLQANDSLESSSLQPFFLTRWGRGVGRFFSSSWQFTKEKTQSYWDSMWDWIEDAVTTYAHEVVTENPSYFPNGDNHNVRDWGGSVYLNTTTPHPGGVQALPPRVLPLP